MSGTRIERCRSCEAANLTEVLSLGRMPLANSLLRTEALAAPEKLYPLDLVFCPACALVQVRETVSRETLFHDYLYFSSVSNTVVENARTIAERLIAGRRLNSTSRVVEVASNDGYLLRHYRRHGIPVLGIEPAANIAERARAEEIPTLCEFFGKDTAEATLSRYGPADVIHANNVLAHVADLNDFVAGFARLLAPKGVAVIEVPYLRHLIERCEFDTIYHEHLCYFSLTSLVPLFARHGLLIVDVELLPIHGGSLRLFVEREGATGGEKGHAVERLLDEEHKWRVADQETYAAFADRVSKRRLSLREAVLRLRRQGSIAAYGAAAKGTVLLNYCGFGRDVIDFVADRSPHKQGRYIPGVRLPIEPPQALRERKPAYVLLLAWNIADEVLAQEAEYRRGGGKFLVPIPSVKIL